MFISCALTPPICSFHSIIYLIGGEVHIRTFVILQIDLELEVEVRYDIWHTVVYNYPISPDI